MKRNFRAALVLAFTLTSVASAASAPKTKKSLVAVTSLSPTDKIPCPKGPACKTFRELAAAGNPSVLNATWACFWNGKGPVDPGEDDPPAGRDPQDRFFLIHYSKPPTADSGTNGPMYDQLVRYGKTDDPDHVTAWNATYSGGLNKAVKETGLKINYGSLWMAYDDRPSALTFDTIEYNMEIVRCMSIARQNGKKDDEAKALCKGLSNKFTIPERAWEQKIEKSTGAFRERTVPLDKELHFLRASHYSGQCLRLK